MLTVGQINEKISELRSKISVTEGVVLYLKTHYMPSDGSQAEMHFTRTDYGKVPPRHIEKTIADYVEYLDALRVELHQMENTPIALPEPTKLVPSDAAEVQTEQPPEQTQTTAKVVSVATAKPNGTKPAAPRKEPHGTARGSQDQPAAQPQPAAGKAG